MAEKKEELRSFDVTEYSEPQDIPDKRATIYKIIEQMARTSPTFAVKAAFVGDLLKLTYHCYEMHLPSRFSQVKEQSKDIFKETLKYLKKEYKSLKKETLELKEKKDMSNDSVQKVSLNERYYYTQWHFYEID